MDKQIEEMAKFSFSVIDNKTGEYPDTYKIALKEDWAKGLMYCDIEGFAINEEGNLVLLDECGKVAYCPSGRFTVIPEGAVVLTKEEYNEYKTLKEAVCEEDLGVVVMKKEEFEKLRMLADECKQWRWKYCNMNASTEEKEDDT